MIQKRLSFTVFCDRCTASYKYKEEEDFPESWEDSFFDQERFDLCPTCVDVRQALLKAFYLGEK